MRTTFYGCTIAIVLSAVAPAAAQESGGSFGGSHFGGSGGGSSSGSSYSGSSGYGSGSHTYASSNGPRDPMDIVVAIGVLALFGSAFYFLRKVYLRPVVDATGPLDLSALSLGIDWRARGAVQQRLKELSARSTSTVGDLTTLLRETVHLLNAARMSWLYGAAVNQHGAGRAEVQSRYQSLTSEMRTRFKRDAIRNVDGQSSENVVADVTARPHEGEGTVVVSIVVAAKGTLADVANGASAQDIDRLLAEYATLDATRLVALEVIWSPAIESDRLSTLELEQFYPELRKLDEASVGGRAFCSFCKGPFASELGTCPHCGAGVTP